MNVIRKLRSLKTKGGVENVLYDTGLEDKVIYPHMINITHVYSFYGAIHALQGCMENKVPFMISCNNESALSL